MIVTTRTAPPPTPQAYYLQPYGLGIIPLIVGAVALGAGALASWFGYKTYSENKDYEAYKATLPPPAPLPPRVAPQSQAEMTVPGMWTPDTEALVYNATLQHKLSHALDQVPTPPETPTSAIPWVTIAVVATLAVGGSALAGRK